VEARPAAMERTERVSIGLIQRNREIAEVREAMLQTDKRLDEAQTRNHILLEETSVLDSTIYEHSGRAASAESQLAALFAQRREKEEELSKQRAVQEAQKTALQGKIADRTEKLHRSEANAASRKDSITALDGEIARLQALLEAENTTIASVRAARQEPFLGRRPTLDAWEAETLRFVEDELEAVHRRQEEHRAEAASARHCFDNLEAELAAERGRRDDVSASLRGAAVEQAEGTKRLRTAEASVASRGGDAKAVLAKLRGTDSAVPSSSSSAVAERVALLRSELQTSEEQSKSLQASLDAQRSQDAQAAEKLGEQLDGARSELQQSLKQAADAHNSEVAKFEQQIQAERQRAVDEEVTQRICMDQITQLKAARDRAQNERGCAIVRTQAEAGRCAALVEELQRVQGELRSAEGRLVAIQERVAQAEQRARDVKSDGARRVAFVRGKIEVLWQGLRSARTSTLRF